ncbi:transposase [Candidatus Gracilibacteria bacterium]|nr:transposase [Candidatus Gracilibacteria bacterium]NJM85928.1 transposase [Hydrococcus sp. RU_2_2]NJP17585.1 transposase [Hydrococcus sp. CRU_1_1]
MWNTIYTAEVLDYLRFNQIEVSPDDVARLSPLKYKHINMLGCYQFSMPDSVRQGKMRRLNLGHGEIYL